MILITGGSFQGKTEFAVMRFPERERIVHFEEQVRDWIREGLDPICQREIGKRASGLRRRDR